jgi:hypothetical protein
MADNYRHYRSVYRGKLPLDARGYPVLTTARLVIEGNPGPTEWLLLDRDNGNPETGRGWVRVFKTRKAARDHKRKQNANPNNARVIGPWRVRDCTSEFLKIERLKPLR